MINYSERPLQLVEHQYAVIDRMRLAELPEGWPLIELVSPMLAPQAHLYPWLVPLHQLPSGEWNAFMAKMSRHTDSVSAPECALLLSSSRPVQDVRSALVNALYFKDAQQRGYILRYYDPRVLFHLHWMLSPWQLFNQLSAQEIPYWSFWLDGRWHTLEFPARESYQPGDRAEMPLEQLQRSGQINLALQKLPRSVDMAQRQKISRRLDTLLMQAEVCGLSIQEDRIAFALHGLSQCEGFWKAPKMAAFLDLARLTPDYYRDATGNWDEHRWMDMTQTESRNAGWNN